MTDLHDYRALDAADPLRHFRQRFHFPQHEGRDSIYFCGNSLGLQPVSVREAVNLELDEWAKWGVEGHFNARNPWLHYHKLLTRHAAALVGGTEREVVVMNTLTVNLHLLLVSFYRPTADRHKIIMEADAFPSDRYALVSQIEHHGFDPKGSLIELTPREGEKALRDEDVLSAIGEAGDSLAVVLLGGVNYYTGQAFDFKAISAAAHKVGAYAGFDCAHAAGNLDLRLHDDDADFAMWCTYKYLNSGPGGPSGIFVHERHGLNPDMPRFAGWWGHEESRRFLMAPDFVPMPGAEGWQLSNAQVLSMAAHKASLEVFAEAGYMPPLVEKSRKLTPYLEVLVERFNREQSAVHIESITPRDPARRGCQLSLVVTKGDGKALYDRISARGVICDWREPDVIRVAPAPLYNSFEDCFRFYEALHA